MSTPSVLPRLAPPPVPVHPLRSALARSLLVAAVLAAGVIAAELVRLDLLAATIAGLVLVRPAVLVHPAALLRPAVLVLAPFRPAGHRRWLVHLSVGLALAAVVGLVWAAGAGPGVLAPLLVTLPLVELWIGWHLARLAAGLRLEDRDSYLRQGRRLGWATLAALLPLLVAGAALAGVAERLPYGLSAHPDAPGVLLGLAGGVLLVGVVAIGWLLAARGRPWLALLTAAPALAGSLAPAGLAPAGLAPAGRAPSGGVPVELLPTSPVPGLVVAYALGLVLAALVLFDLRSSR